MLGELYGIHEHEFGRSDLLGGARQDDADGTDGWGEECQEELF